MKSLIVWLKIKYKGPIPVIFNTLKSIAIQHT